MRIEDFQNAMKKMAPLLNARLPGRLREQGKKGITELMSDPLIRDSIRFLSHKDASHEEKLGIIALVLEGAYVQGLRDGGNLFARCLKELITEVVDEMQAKDATDSAGVVTGQRMLGPKLND